MFVQKEKKAGRKQRKVNLSKTEKPIQAKIGFEFETSKWMVFKPAAEPRKEGELTSEEYFASVMYKKAHVLFENPFWSAQTDVDDVRVSHLELVTIPFEEDAAGYGQLERTMDEIENFFKYVFRVPCKEEEGRRIVPIEALSMFGEVKSPEAFLAVSRDDLSLDIFPQATAGVRLSKLHKLISNVSAAPEAESSELRKRKHLGRMYLMGESKTGHYPEDTAVNARIAVDLADLVLDQVLSDWHMEFSDSFKGFLSLVIYYLFEGDRGTNIFPKAFTAFLARTDFARMFSLLPEQERDFLAKNGANTWFKILHAVMPGDFSDFSKPFFKSGVFISRPEIHRHILKALSKEQWLMEMTRGRDLLTERHFPNRWRAYELESLGAMGEKTDTVLGEPAPIIEFRVGKKYLNMRELRLFALETFKMIYALNRGIDHFFGESVEVR
ncbi:MAG: hypothetical protein MI784_11045 [Cytophagales bacterium]|nr:hypothetical protein [Cytophagales bacterium]